MDKKAFQKAIGKIRREIGTGEYPKAMMTMQQAANDTATVNCGGEYDSAASKKIANDVINNNIFLKLMSENTALFEIEPVGKCGGVQIRIRYNKKMEKPLKLNDRITDFSTGGYSEFEWVDKK